MTTSIGRVGIWTPSYVWESVPGREAAAELEELGFGALWVSSSASALGLAEELLGATRQITVATGILNAFAVDADEAAAGFQRLESLFPGRFLLGLGISHKPSVEALGKVYERPIEYLTGYLDQLDRAATPVPVDRRVLAALGPKALRLAGTRSRGAHPYLVTPEHTARAREVLGDGPLLAPEQKVLFSTDTAEGRALARRTVRYYLRLPNYVRSLRSIGFTEEDVAGEGSDRLIDALVAHGTPEQIADRIDAHHKAGADHVAVQVLAPDLDIATRRGTLNLDGWRRLAEILH